MGKRKRNNDCEEYENNGAGGFEAPSENVEGEPQQKAQNTNESPLHGSNNEDTATEQITTEIASVQAQSEQPQLPEAKTVPQLRTSVRVQNKKREESRTDNASLESAKKVEEEEDDAKGDQKEEGKKRRRAWEVWSMEDKDGFFEAINECGKDFEGIQAYLSSKLRKKGNTTFGPKNKDQVRHFYYRTWHKICKYVEFSEGVKKATQELYALINYGEFRRKVGGTLNEKKGVKLHQLIQKGSASIRVKGKSIRVRTPICRALKRINEYQDDREQSGPKLPASVSVEITPANNDAWMYVQGLAHNPRVRIVCALGKPLSSVISLLQNKWRSKELKLCERLVSSLSMQTKIPAGPELNLRLRPPQDADIQLCDVQADALMTSSTVSLLRHEEFVRSKMENTTHARSDKKKSKNISRTADKNATSSCAKDDDECYTGDLSQEEGSDCETEDCSDKTSDVKVKIEPSESSDAAMKEENAPVDTLRQLKALNTVATPTDTTADDDVVFVGENTGLLCQARDQQQRSGDVMPPTPETEDEDVIHVPDIETEPKQKTEGIRAMKNKILQGWATDSCCNYTVGQLYMMLGKNKKLSLEYMFEPPEETKDQNVDTNSNQMTQPSPETVEASCTNSQDAEEKASECSEILLKLLSLVETGSSKSIDCQHCGQMPLKTNCKSPAAARIFGRSPTQSRSPRISSHVNRSPKATVQSKSSAVSQRKNGLSKPASAKRLIPPAEAEDKTVHTPSMSVQVSSAPTTFPVNEGEVKADAGTFKVPFAPISRTLYGANMNQKLLPKYIRPNRRTATHRKHMFVQRQLPLLPNIPAQKPGNIITLNVLQQPAIPGSQANTLIQVPVAMKMPADKPLIAVGNQVAEPANLGPAHTSAISVNVSGQQLLSVQMAPSTSDLTNSMVQTVNYPIIQTSVVPALIAQTFTTASTTVTNSWAVNSEKTPISSVTQPPTSNILSNLMHDAIGDFSGLDAPMETSLVQDTPFTEFKSSLPSPLKTPVKAFSENSCSSVLTTPKNVNLEPLATSAASAKLDLSTYLNAPCFSPCPSPSPSLISIGDCPSIPEIHIPESVGNLPLLDISMGGTVTVLNNDTRVENNLVPEKESKEVPEQATSSTPQNAQIPESSKSQIIDLSLANSNSSFSTFLSAVIHPAVDVNESTLQTPPKRMISSPLKGERPSFKAALFENQPVPSPISEIPSPISPTRYLSQSDAQWLNNEVNDLSLSRILGQIDSPFKTPMNGLPIPLNKDDLPLFPVNDNSVDFRTTFAALKAQISEEEVEGQ